MTETVKDGHPVLTYESRHSVEWLMERLGQDRLDKPINPRERMQVLWDSH